jgi:EAL and modified HD-GYP domain-containing signal transduction protein
MSDVFVARQPIFDRGLHLVGYELLYRPSYAAVGAEGADADSMTGSVMVNGLLGLGLGQLTGGTRAWVNFTREALLQGDADLLDPRACVVELLETISCDAEVVAACQQLRAKGYTIALDDFVSDVDTYRPLLELAQIVKISVLEATEAELRASVAALKPFPVQLLAEKVENQATYSLCRSLGFSLFQGHHFSRPQVVRGRDLPGELQAIARLMNLTQDPRARDADLVREFRTDPGLSVKLLKIVNSAACGGIGIESIPHAIRLVGRGPLHRWLALLFASSVPRGDDVSQELVLMAMERGRFAELLAERSGRAAAADALFLAGMLSMFNAILGVPMPALLEQIHVAPDIEAALLRGTGPLAPYLDLATKYANGMWEEAIVLGGQMGVLDDLSLTYVEATGWAREILMPRQAADR